MFSMPAHRSFSFQGMGGSFSSILTVLCSVQLMVLKRGLKFLYQGFSVDKWICSVWITQGTLDLEYEIVHNFQSLIETIIDTEIIRELDFV